jgi:hypothetical protein
MPVLSLKAFPAQAPLWCLYFLKQGESSWENLATILHTNHVTVHKYIALMVVYLKQALPPVCTTKSAILPTQFDFSMRFKNWPFLQPSCLIDTTFIWTSKPYLSPWEYYNKDKHKYGIIYIVVCSLGKPFRFLAAYGPFKGAAADVSTFRMTLLPLLRHGEKLMGDRGYWQDLEHIWSPPTGDINTLTVEEKQQRREVTRIRHTVERLLGRLKQWNVLVRKWHLGFRFHQDCFDVCAKLTDLSVHYQPLT